MSLKMSENCVEASPGTPAPMVFKIGDDLVLRPAPNGGWIVGVCDRGRTSPKKVLGAFSTTKEMLAALVAALAPPESN